MAEIAGACASCFKTAEASLSVARELAAVFGPVLAQCKSAPELRTFAASTAMGAEQAARELAIIEARAARSELLQRLVDEYGRHASAPPAAAAAAAAVDFDADALWQTLPESSEPLLVDSAESEQPTKPSRCRGRRK